MKKRHLLQWFWELLKVYEYFDHVLLLKQQYWLRNPKLSRLGNITCNQYSIWRKCLRKMVWTQNSYNIKNSNHFELMSLSLLNKLFI